MPTDAVPTNAAPATGGESHLRIVWVYPDLLSTYGDRGNLLILARRAQARGIDVETIPVAYDETLPRDADIYLVGGGEDRPQGLAAARLRADGGLTAAVDRGAAVLAICAGYQLIGQSFHLDGQQVAGVGLLDVYSDRGESRAVGELAGEVDPELGLPTLTGFENHAGRTRLGANVAPLARVTTGIGNDGRTEGACQDKVLGTYLHGPALARNPALADLVLSLIVGELSTLDSTWTDRLRAERLAAISA